MEKRKYTHKQVKVPQMLGEVWSAMVATFITLVLLKMILTALVWLMG